MVNNKVTYLGLYTTPEEASRVFQAFAKEHHKEFYRDTTQ